MSPSKTRCSTLPRHSLKNIQFDFAPLVGLLLAAEFAVFAGLSSLQLRVQASNGPQSAIQQKQEETELHVGDSQTHELTVGQSHAYRIALIKGQYLRVVVEQRGIDVSVVLSGPDGKQIIEFDDEIRSHGLEMATEVAESSGRYLLSVRSRQKGIPVGRYEIQVAELRTATENDRALHEARQLHAESVKLYRAGKFNEGHVLIERALELREKWLGREHLAVAKSLNILANFYFAKGEYAKAEPLYQRALQIREKILGTEHPEVAASFANLALLLRLKGDYGKAEPLFLRALEIEEKTLGPEHPSVAQSLHVLAGFYNFKADYAKAESLYLRALSIREKALGPNHSSVASSLNSLAALYFNKGDYAKAESLYLRAVTVYERAFGPEHPDTATPVHNLGILYNVIGEYVKAEPLYLRALDIREKVMGPEHQTVAATVNSLAILHREKGDYEKAEPLYLRALDIREKTLGPQHPLVAASLDNLALLYGDKGLYVKAEPLHQRALTIREKALGPEHPDVAVSFNNLAELCRYKGEYAKAEQLHRQALAIREKLLGPEHPEVAKSLYHLAFLLFAKGEYAKAEPLYLRALAIREKALGAEQPEVAQNLSAIARLYTAMGETVQAVKFQSRACAIAERNIALNLVAGSERQKLAYLTTLLEQTDQTLSLHTNSAPNDSTAINLALTTILQRKGRTLDAITNDLAALRRRAGPEEQVLLDRFKETRAQLARLVLGGQQNATPSEHKSRINNLREQLEALEGEISRHSDEFRAMAQPITIAAVRAAIPANVALIEFAAYRPFNADHTKPNEQFGLPHYAAYILRSQGETQWIGLGEKQAIDTSVAALRRALRNPNRTDVKRVARALDELVMRPIRKLLGETRAVLLSPDGTLNLIPFGALVDEQNRYLIENYSFTYLTSGRDLLRLQSRRPNRQGPMVVANPKFDASEKPAETNLTLRRNSEGRRFAEFTQVDFDPLPHTATEAKAIGAILHDAKVLTGAEATEAAVKQLKGPSILHIATHGFFLTDRKLESADTNSSGSGESAIRFKKTENTLTEDSLLRSGLILAGANQRRSGEEEDGVLTALEVAALDLSGTKLVVLSACDTGVGDVRNGEGVYGLRRALVSAGSESQVMSLWSVSDKSTRELMINYYTALQRKEGRSEALRGVQLKMLDSSGRRHPFHWAGFIQSGEWANLDGKR